MTENVSPIAERVRADMKTAMKSGDKRRLGIVRLIRAAINQREIDERITLDDGQITSVLGKMAKQRRESIDQFRSAKRDDLVEQESFELQVIQDYLPAPLAPEEVEALIDAAIEQVGAASMKDMGKVMGVLRPRVQGRVDMGAISARVKGRLGA